MQPIYVTLQVRFLLPVLTFDSMQMTLIADICLFVVYSVQESKRDMQPSAW
jgi:hypothetical protein